MHRVPPVSYLRGSPDAVGGMFSLSGVTMVPRGAGGGVTWGVTSVSRSWRAWPGGAGHPAPRWGRGLRHLCNKDGKKLEERGKHEMITLTVPDPPLSGHRGVVSLRLRVVRGPEVLLARPHPLWPRHEVVTRPVQDVGTVAPLQKLLLGSLLLVKVEAEGGDGGVERGVLGAEHPQELRAGQGAQGVRGLREPATRILALFTILNYIGFKYQKFPNLKKCNQQELSLDAQPMSEKYYYLKIDWQPIHLPSHFSWDSDYWPLWAILRVDRGLITPWPWPGLWARLQWSPLLIVTWSLKLLSQSNLFYSDLPALGQTWKLWSFWPWSSRGGCRWRGPVWCCGCH